LKIWRVAWRVFVEMRDDTNGGRTKSHGLPGCVRVRVRFLCFADLGLFYYRDRKRVKRMVVIIMFWYPSSIPPSVGRICKKGIVLCCVVMRNSPPHTIFSHLTHSRCDWWWDVGKKFIPKIIILWSKLGMRLISGLEFRVPSHVTSGTCTCLTVTSFFRFLFSCIAILVA